MSKANLGKLNKKTFYLFLFLSLLIIQLNAQIVPHNTNWKLTVEPFIGITGGTIYESLYSAEILEHKNSLLEWNMSPLYVYGLNIKGGYKNFSLSLDVTNALPVYCGKMYDSDWLPDGTKFCYGIQEEFAEENYNFNLSAFYDFYITNYFIISPKTSLQYSFNSFQAKNGYGWYGLPDYTTDGQYHSWDSLYSRYFPPTSGMQGIHYFQESFFVFVGTQFEYNINEKLKFSIAPEVSCYSYTIYEDHHQNSLGGIKEYGITKSIFNAFKIESLFSIKLNKFIELATKFNGAFMLETKGDLYCGSMLEDKKISTSLFNFNIFTGCSIIVF